MYLELFDAFHSYTSVYTRSMCNEGHSDSCYEDPHSKGSIDHHSFPHTMKSIPAMQQRSRDLEKDN